MAKDTRLDLTPWPPYKHRLAFAKAFVAVLLIGFAVYLFFDRSTEFVPVSDSAAAAAAAAAAGSRPEATVGAGPAEIQKDSPSGNESGTPKTPSTESSTEFEDQDAQKDDFAEKCDLFTGEWVHDPSGPIYTNESCPIVEAHQNCMKNGRPDSEYLYWRWKPRDCELPSFDARRFLDAMQNKSWAFIGDSISRNHVQSLVCLLSKAEQAIEFYHDEEYKSKKWRFPSYNFTLAVIWSPFLLKADIFEDSNGVSTSETQLHLDILDKKWTSEYRNFDYIVTSGGKWFLKTAVYWENNTVVGCHYCPGKNLTELGFDYAYRKALSLVLNLLTTSYRGTVLLRTSTPSHFENGEWHNGGTCNRTVPFSEGDTMLADVDQILHNIELEVYNKALNAASENGVVLKLLDTTHLSLLRPDGHPGPYRKFHPFAENKNAKIQNDCLHWCLPGPIDSWNDLVMKMVLND